MLQFVNCATHFLGFDTCMKVLNVPRSEVAIPIGIKMYAGHATTPAAKADRALITAKIYKASKAMMKRFAPVNHRITPTLRKNLTTAIPLLKAAGLSCVRRG